MKNIFFVDENGQPFSDWEEKKLGDVSSLKNGYSFDSKSYQENGKYLVTTISNVTGDLYVDSRGSKRVRNIPTDIRPHQILKTGDILISLTGNVGRISVVNEDNLLLNQRVGLIEIHDSSIDEKFIYQVLSSKLFENAMINAGQGAAQKNIKKEDVENYPFLLPSLPEQKKIAEFFSALDERITLQSEKVALLKEHKKGIQQKIFNRELVFTDDNGDAYPEWENYKVEDIFQVTRGKVIAKPSLSQSKTETHQYPVYSSQTTNKGILGWSDTYDFEGEYITWTTDGANAGRVFSRRGKFRCTNVCGVLKEKKETQGTANLLVSEILNLAASKYVMRGLGNPKLMSDVMRRVPISIPSMGEQKKISILFEMLDKQIELNQEKLSLLQEQKKGYLQGIFQ